MDIAMIQELIAGLGFPIVCVLGLGWFVYKIWKSYKEDMKNELDAMAKRCQAREDKLYEQIDKFNTTMNNFNGTLIKIDTRLEQLENKINE